MYPRSSFELEQNRSWLWMVVQNELRTVRSMGADGPPLKTETGVETWSFCMGCPNELWTVRHLWGGPSARAVTVDSEKHLLRILPLGLKWRTVRALWGRLSVKTLFSRDLSVTASLGFPSINRGGGWPFDRLSTLGTWCPCVRVLEIPLSHFKLISISTLLHITRWHKGIKLQCDWSWFIWRALE